MDANVKKLIDEARAGSGSAFVELVTLFQDQVRSAVRRWVPAHDADDVAQEVFVALACRIRDAGQAQLESPGLWLKTVARNKAVGHLRKHSRTKMVLTASLGWVEDRSGVVIDDVIDDANAPDRAALRQCVEMLQQDHREILERFYSRGQSTELIANQLGRGAGAIRMILVRIRRALAKCIRKRVALS